MKKQNFKNICDILNEISPHSKEVKKFLLTKKNRAKQSAEKNHTVETVIENIIENIDTEIETDDRNLVLNGNDSKLRELEEFLEQNNDVDLDMDVILNKLNEIKNEIDTIKENDIESEEIKEIKNNFQEQREEIKKEERENKEKDELKDKEEKDTEKNLEEIKTKENEEIERNEEQEKINKEEIGDREDEEKEVRQEEQSTEEKLNQEKEEKEHQEIEDENKENNIPLNDKNEIENKNEVKSFLDKIGESSIGIDDKSFTEKIMDEKEKIQTAKNVLEANSLKDVSSAKQKMNEIDNEIKRIEGIISDLQSMGIEPPADLMSQLQSLTANKGSIGAAIDTISSTGLSK